MRHKSPPALGQEVRKKSHTPAVERGMHDDEPVRKRASRRSLFPSSRSCATGCVKKVLTKREAQVRGAEGTYHCLSHRQNTGGEVVSTTLAVHTYRLGGSAP